jgi:hypothetical protein
MIPLVKQPWKNYINGFRECYSFGLVYYVFHISLFVHVAEYHKLVLWRHSQRVTSWINEKECDLLTELLDVS